MMLVPGIWVPKEPVKAAHFVPKALSSEEVSHLRRRRGGLKSPRNGLPLHKAVEAASESGRIVIIPILNGTPMRWKCMLVEQDCRQNTIFRTLARIPSQSFGMYGCSLHILRALPTFLWDIDQQQLTFKGLDRPARRFLYFRFIITYLHVKTSGNVSFTNSVESNILGVWREIRPQVNTQEPGNEHIRTGIA